MARSATAQFDDDAIARRLARPLIILSAPRAGSTLLFEQLARADGFWTVGGESHGIFRAFPELRAENAVLDSGRLDATHATTTVQTSLRRCFLALLRDHRGEPFIRLTPERQPATVTLLEKTPRNALNVPFLTEVFPDARFVFLYRDARQMVERWLADRPVRDVSRLAGLGSTRLVLSSATRLAVHDRQEPGRRGRLPVVGDEPHSAR